MCPLANPEFGIRNSEFGICHPAFRTPHSAFRVSRHTAFRVPRSAFRVCQAFTRTDLLVTLGMFTLLGTCLVSGCRGVSEKARIATCAGNLTALGKAIHTYAKDHGDALPWGSMQYGQGHQITWDTQTKPYLMGELQKTNSALAAKTRERAIVTLLACPSDALSRDATKRGVNAKPRSYSMAAHDMSQKNWPPGPENTTGVGLHWSFGFQGTNPPPERIYNFKNTNEQAVVKLAMIAAPKDTLLLTEQIQTNNLAWTANRATVASTAQQLATNLIPAGQFHESQFNYLMVDGHVELLSPKQTVGHGGEVGGNAQKHKGIWTIKPGD